MLRVYKIDKASTFDPPHHIYQDKYYDDTKMLRRMLTRGNMRCISKVLTTILVY